MIRKAMYVLLLLFVSASTAEAKHRHHHRGGSCDGVHRCRCGTTQASHFGLPLAYKGFNLKQARDWTRAFPHTTPAAGVVVYQRSGGYTGHVSRIISYSGACTATVADDKGTYERNICGRGAAYLAVGW